MRTLSLAISLCLVSVSLVALNRPAFASPPPTVLTDPVQYQIYSEVLSNFFSDASAVKSSDPIFISNHTPAQTGKAKTANQKALSDHFLIERFGEVLEQETIDDYDKNRAAVVGLGPRFSLQVHVVLMSDAELARIVTQSSGGLPEAYRSGIVTFSRVGFNARKTQAVVSLDYFCGPFCATDEMFLLAKSGNVWKVLNKIPIFEG